MNENGLRILVKQLENCVEIAKAAIGAADFEAAESQMEVFSLQYEAYCEASNEKDPDEQHDDAQDHQRHEEKGCVPDSPHDGYVLGS